jgi:hypothetical protein
VNFDDVLLEILARPGGPRFLKRRLAIDMAGQLGAEMCMRGEAPNSYRIRTPKERTAHHEAAHALVKFLFKMPNVAIAVLPQGGGICGGFASLPEAQTEYAGEPFNDDEKNAAYDRVFTAAGYSDSVSRIKKMTTRLLRKHWHVVRQLAGMSLHKGGFLNDEEVSEIIAKYR